MRGRIRVAVALLTAAVFAPALLRPALADQSFTRYYTNGGGVTVAGVNVLRTAACLPTTVQPEVVDVPWPDIPRPGGTCFDIPTGSSLDVTVRDATTLPVAFQYAFQWDEPRGVACGSAHNVPIPAGATRIVVWLVTDAPPTDCFGAVTPTAGTITVDYH